MAIWETSSPYSVWISSTGAIASRPGFIVTKITDDKTNETTLEIGEDIKITVLHTRNNSTNVVEGKFLGTVTVDGVVYPVVSVTSVTVYGSRLIVGLDPSAAGVPSTLSNTSLDENTFTVCFFPDTLIATPSGERKIEELISGDPVLIGDSGAIPATWLRRKFVPAVSVKWIGRQTVSTLFGPAERLMPVRFAAGSLGGGGGANPSTA